MSRACRVVLVLATIAAVLPVFAEVHPRKLQTAGLQCKNGEKAMAAGNRSAAREAYEKALVAVPAYPEAHIGLGTLAMAEGKFEAALAEYRHALDGYAALGADMEQVEMRRYADVQDRKRALRDEQSALMNPTSKVSETARQSRLTSIESEMRQLDAVDPPRAGQTPQPPGEVHFHIGNALMRLSRMPEAVAEWETCAAASPKFGPVHNNLAFAYWKSGRLGDARKSLARAEELGFPVNPQFKKDLGGAP